MAYEYESIISGVFNFTIPGEEKTVKLFKGDKVVVQKQLTGTYLKMLKLIGEINSVESIEKKEPVKKTTKQRAKVADKITKVAEIETKDLEETVSVDIKDEVTTDTIVEEEAAPAPKKRGRRKKS